MKPPFPYLIGSLLLLGGATSCSKTEVTPQPEFFVQASKNFAPWIGKGSGTFSKARKEYYIFGLLGNAARAESFSLGFSLPASPQLTPVQALQARWTVLVGYDGVSDSYESDAANLPTIEITRLDTVAKVVEGRFKTTLIRDKYRTSETETMRFTNGSFRVQYITYP